MKQNIYVIIGENASGKTRYLTKILDEALEKGMKISTNIRKFEAMTTDEIDENKVNTLIRHRNKLPNMKFEDKKDNPLHDMYRYLVSKGDILVLDELDFRIGLSDVMMLFKAVADVRECWKEIYVSSYNYNIGRVFLDIDPEDFTETYTPQFMMVNKKLEAISITEDDALEYFDKI